MNEMLDFLKAMSNPDRLRIIGMLAQKPATGVQISERLKISNQKSMGHLEFLEKVGAVTQKNGVYSMNDNQLAELAREKLAETRPPQYVPSEDLDEYSRKVLKVHLNADGSIKQIPQQPAKLMVILNYLLKFFETDAIYTEKEVNEIIRRYNEDTAGLRRDLIEAGLLARESDGSRYWKVK